jgi:hypothetical protein
MLKILFTFVTKRATLMRRLSTVLSFPLTLVFPGLTFNCVLKIRMATSLKGVSHKPMLISEASTIYALQLSLTIITVACTVNVYAGNPEGGSITVPLTSCLTGLD